MRQTTLTLLMLTVAHAVGLAAQAADTVVQPKPLFTAHDLIQLTIEAPLKTVFKERGQESEYHDGLLRYQDAAGQRVELEVGVKTRGKYRLSPRNCGFPPLRVNFKRKQVEGTVFEGQDRLKLVTHCRDGSRNYEQYVLQEYLVYRLYNQLTELSFRVRLAHITYIDRDGDRDTLTRYAFFIEDEDAMAARNGWEVLNVPIVPPDEYELRQANMVEVFQYMIGNTDWGHTRGPPDEPFCCHNVKVVGSYTSAGAFPVPYDFDFSGIIKTRYAIPDPKVEIRDVRQRRYWGICRPGDANRAKLDEIFAEFEQVEEQLYDLYRNQEALDPKTAERTIEYIGEFYEFIADRRRTFGVFDRECRAVRLR
jgi:hypothetical protein